MINRFCLETLGLFPGVTIAGISVHTKCAHRGGFRNRGVIEVGNKTHQNELVTKLIKTSSEFIPVSGVLDTS